MGMYNFFQPDAVQADVDKICRFIPHICEGLEILIKAFSGHKSKDVYDMEMSGAGWRTFVHFGQMMKAEEFQRYDWGYFINLLRYG